MHDLMLWSNRPTPPGFEVVDYTPALIEAALTMLWGGAELGRVSTVGGSADIEDGVSDGRSDYMQEGDGAPADSLRMKIAVIPAKGVNPETIRTKADPSHSNTGHAIYADIQLAWAWLSSEPEQRRALFLFYGAGWTVRQIAEYEGVGKSTAQRRLTAGIANLAAYLNGRYILLSTGRGSEDSDD